MVLTFSSLATKKNLLAGGGSSEKIKFDKEVFEKTTRILKNGSIINIHIGHELGCFNKLYYLGVLREGNVWPISLPTLKSIFLDLEFEDENIVCFIHIENHTVSVGDISRLIGFDEPLRGIFESPINNKKENKKVHKKDLDVYEKLVFRLSQDEKLSGDEMIDFFKNISSQVKYDIDMGDLFMKTGCLFKALNNY
jgi:hypothetical protein